MHCSYFDKFKVNVSIWTLFPRSSHICKFQRGECMMLGSGALQKKPALSYCKAGLYGWWDCVGTLAGNFENNRRAHSYFSMKILNLYLVFHGNTADYLFSKSNSARLIYKVSFISEEHKSELQS